MLFKKLSVELGERSYPVYVGRDMLSSLAPSVQERGLSGRVAVIADDRVASLYLRPVERHLRHFGFDVCSIVIPSGERQKSLSRANKIYAHMLKVGIDRTSFVLALGGGVIGDLAGFVAATYQRGVPLVHVPTTLLAQVDSSIGGKVGVNHPLGKNMIGAFYQPALVWVDADTLSTLPSREVVCGMGEVVKYGIALDEDLFEYLEDNLPRILKLNPDTMLHVQTRCIELKSRIVQKDERESGLRAVLNLGHTVGHALEAAGKFRFLKHGEAVLLGMLAESYIAREIKVIPEEVHARIVRLISRLPVPRRVWNFSNAEVLRLMQHDKKSLKGKNRFVLPTRVGAAELVEGVESALVTQSLKYLRSLNG